MDVELWSAEASNKFKIGLRDPIFIQPNILSLDDVLLLILYNPPFFFFFLLFCVIYCLEFNCNLKTKLSRIQFSMAQLFFLDITSADFSFPFSPVYSSIPYALLLPSVRC